MIKKILTIAGSDCSGGAGIQADLKTFCAHNTYGMSVITAITAQNSKGVYDIFNVSETSIREQLKAVFEDFVPDAIKIGMLSNLETCKEVFNFLKNYKKHIVVDPVMISTSGKRLLDINTIEFLKSTIFKIATLITPNIQEAEYLSGIKINTDDDIPLAFNKIRQFTQANVLIKGGHLGKEESNDYLFIDGQLNILNGIRINSKNTHGTGCTLSSAIAANLAKGQTLIEATINAKKYITLAIKNDLNLKEDNGPLNHMYFLKD